MSLTLQQIKFGDPFLVMDFVVVVVVFAVDDVVVVFFSSPPHKELLSEWKKEALLPCQGLLANTIA